jgi:hypothetical protein
METASLSEIKKELKNLTPQQLQEILLRLARFKKENKELLGYLLFDAFNQPAYIQTVKDEIDEQFKNLHKSSPYLTKKAIRKTLRNTNKYIRFSGSKETEIELLVYFCQQMRKHGHRLSYSRMLANLYMNQVKRAKKTLSTLHEDLQLDYEEAMKNL